MRIVDNNLLTNCPIARRDILIAEDIFGPDVRSLKGKTVWGTQPHVQLLHTNIPPSTIEHYRDIILAGDIMSVNRVPFFVTMARNI